MFPVWPLLVYFFTTGLGADFQALISPGGVVGIDQAGKCKIKTDASSYLFIFLPPMQICGHYTYCRQILFYCSFLMSLFFVLRP